MIRRVDRKQPGAGRGAGAARLLSATSAIACGLATAAACATPHPPASSSAVSKAAPVPPDAASRHAPADAGTAWQSLPAAQPTPAAATGTVKSPPAPANAIVFGRGHALWRIDPRGGAATKLADLGADASQIHSLASNRQGTLLVVDLGDAAYSLALGAEPNARLRRLACTGPARTAADGSGAMCPGEHGATLLYAFSARGRIERAVRKLPGPATAFLGHRPPAFLVVRHGALWRTDLGRHPDRVLAPRAPSKHLLVAPNGKRAVGTYRIDGLDRLCTFQLDGRAARRRLITEGVPAGWSWNSRWVLIQDGRRGCLVRAVGGEYKCWRRYKAISLTWNGEHVLLRRPVSGHGPIKLYTAPLAGAHAERPHLVVKGAQGAALWLSAPPPHHPAQ